MSPSSPSKVAPTGVCCPEEHALFPTLPSLAPCSEAHARRRWPPLHVFQRAGRRARSPRPPTGGGHSSCTCRAATLWVRSVTSQSGGGVAARVSGNEAVRGRCTNTRGRGTRPARPRPQVRNPFLRNPVMSMVGWDTAPGPSQWDMPSQTGPVQASSAGGLAARVVGLDALAKGKARAERRAEHDRCNGGHAAD